MTERDATNKAPEPSDGSGVLSRRQALTAAGALAAIGVAAAPGTAAAAAGPSPDGGPVGIAPKPANAVEFRAHFTQTGSTGEHFEAYGYLTRAAGAGDAELFSGGPPGEATALFTAVAKGDLTNRVHDASGVHTLDVVGTLTVYQRPAPGATFLDPGSFAVGTAVAEYDVALHDILTVILPGRGLPTLNGAMRQTSAGRIAGPAPARQFGRKGSEARLFATGLGTLVDPATLNSTLDMGGNWVVE